MNPKHFLFLTLFTPLTFSGLASADTALTIYNQDFAVVRDTVPLDLKAGENDVRFSDTTAKLEPDSVVLRDPTGKIKLQVLEQSYRNDPVSQALLLSLNEGKTIDFLLEKPGMLSSTVSGKIIRSGYAPGSDAQNTQPVIEVNGKLQFSLPGQPIFPSLGDDTILQPTLTWKLYSDQTAQIQAELAYVTAGLSWNASYNVVVPEKGDLIDLVGWITMDNHSGKTFREANVKLMAGDVNKVVPKQATDLQDQLSYAPTTTVPAPVTQKTLDEFHLYSLPRAVSLHDAEIKQVEFIRATGIKSEKIYVFDAAQVDNTGKGKIAVIRQFKNAEANNLGLPLPKGRIRFYQQDDQSLQFIGENDIDHTPKDELIKIELGKAFDLSGERRQTDQSTNDKQHWSEEAYEVKLRNHKTEPVEIRVVEHFFNYATWSITEKSDPLTKTNAQEAEFRVTVKPDEEKIVTYRVHYSW